MDEKLPLNFTRISSEKNGDEHSPFDAIEALEIQGEFLIHHLDKLKLIETKLSELENLVSKKQ